MKKIAVEEGYMRGVVTDSNGNWYTYMYDDDKTGKNCFVDEYDNHYIETKRDAVGDVCEIELRGDL